MVNIAKRKKQLLEALAKDTARIEDEYKQEGLEEYNGPDPHVDSMKARVEWALNQQNTDIGDLEILLSNVQTASNEVPLHPNSCHPLSKHPPSHIPLLTPRDFSS